VVPNSVELVCTDIILVSTDRTSVKPTVSSTSGINYTELERSNVTSDPQKKGDWVLSVKEFARKLGLDVPVIVLCTFAVYWHDLTILWDDVLNNEMASYILALPFLMAYMIYRRRNVIKAQLSLEIEEQERMIIKDMIGVSLCLSALLIYVYGSFTFRTLEYHLISLTVFLTGCSVLLAGIQNLRNLAFPLGFLLLLVIPYREEAYQVGGQLSTLSSVLAFNILRILNYPVSLSSTYEAPSIMIEVPSGEYVPFVIDIPCAGAYSLIGFLVFALFFTYVSRGTQLRKIGWLTAGFLLIYGINIARILLTLMIGHTLGIDAAMGLFHLASGTVLIFLASLLMILIGEKILKIRISEMETKTEMCPLCEENKRRNEPFCTFCGRFFNLSSIRPSRAYLAELAAIAFLMMLVINLQVPSFTLAQHNVMEMDLHELAGMKETKGFLPPVELYEPTFLYRDERFEEVARQDASLLYVYRPQNNSYAPIFVSVEIADSYSKLHRWEICLFISEPDPIVNPIVSKDIQIMENPPVTGRIFTFKYVESEQPVTILYWYEKSAFRIGQTWANRYVKTSIIAYLSNFVETGEIRSLDDYNRLESKLASIARNIVTYWEPVKAWSDFVVAFAGWGQTMAILTMIVSSSISLILHLKRRREEEERAGSNHKQLIWHSAFSKEEREILEILEVLAEEERSTGIQLSKSYEEKTGKRIKPAKLMGMMMHAEKFGLAKKEIIGKENSAELVWRTS